MLRPRIVEQASKHTPRCHPCHTARTWSYPCRGYREGGKYPGKGTCCDHVPERIDDRDLLALAFSSYRYTYASRSSRVLPTSRQTSVDHGWLTTVNVLAVPVLTSQTARLVAQGVQLRRREFRFMLKLAEFAVLAVTTEMPVVAHFLARALHAFIE
jgi:hypothetical protein